MGMWNRLLCLNMFDGFTIISDLVFQPLPSQIDPNDSGYEICGQGGP